MDRQAAKAAAKRLFQKVNYSGGPLQSYELSSLLTETYQHLKIPFKPTSQDIKMYSQILDDNKDGQVTLNDLQNKAIQYLCGPGILKPQSSVSNQKASTYGVTQSNSTPFATNYTSSTSFQQKTVSNINNLNNPIPVQKQNNVSSQRPVPSPVRDQPVRSANREYNQQTMQYISVIKQIFENNSTKYGTITQDRVAKLLQQTYQVLGRSNYRAQRQDIKAWMSLCDQNMDGHVQYEQYCYFVLKQLQQSGYQIYK